MAPLNLMHGDTSLAFRGVSAITSCFSLKVGERVRGPTCVWQRLPDTHGEKLEQCFGPLTTVPAVPGRLLRFRGDLQHAVPRPADVWLAPFVVKAAFLNMATEHVPFLADASARRPSAPSLPL